MESSKFDTVVKHLNIASKQIVLSLCQMESFGKRKWRLKIQKVAAFLHLPPFIIFTMRRVSWIITFKLGRKVCEIVVKHAEFTR